MATATASTSAQLGHALREARLAQGMTQSALAELASVGRQWLNAFEAGDKPSAPVDMIFRLLTALGVSVTLTGDGHLLVQGAEQAVDDVIDLGALVDEDVR